MAVPRRLRLEALPSASGGISRLVAVSIVYRLEMVEVYQDNGGALSKSLMPFDDLLENTLHFSAVVEAGQAIAHCEVTQDNLGALAVCYISRQNTKNVPTAVGNMDVADFHRNYGTILTAIAAFINPRFAERRFPGNFLPRQFIAVRDLNRIHGYL